ncbi:MAG: HD domain-containing protein [Solirubrobacterales bacterium]|nr:HD domain-containing protein [Solirubrobacterales bacterium]
MTPTLRELGLRTLAATPVSVLREPLSGEPVWVVGGTVRDLALGREPAEVDLAVPGSPEPVARRLASALDGAAFELSSEFPAWRVSGRESQWQVDIARLRGDGGIEQDLRLRDFTLGAIAVDLASGEVLDPTGGLVDLERGTIRACSDHSFLDDPLRLMRAARLVSRFGWSLEPETVKLARSAAARGADPAGERILSELLALISGPDPLAGLAVMDSVGLLGSVLPEIAGLKGVTQGPNHHRDAYGHTIEVIEGVLEIESDPGRFVGDRAAEVSLLLAEPLADGASRATGLRLGALFHDCAKMATRREEGGFVTFRGHDRAGADTVRRIFGERFHSSRRLREYVAGLTRNHLKLGFMVADRPLGRRQVYEYLVQTDPDPVDVTLLTVADRLAARGSSPIAGEEMMRGHLELAREMVGHGLDWRRSGYPEPPIGGAELARSLGIEPGPGLGELMRELSAARYAGEIKTADEAIRHARRHLNPD